MTDLVLLAVVPAPPFVSLTPAQVVVPLALGVHLTALLALLVLDPRNRLVRWFAAFQAGLTAWLSLELIELLGAGGAWAPLAGDVVTHLLPVVFLAFALVLHGWRDGRALAVVAAGALLLPLAHARSPLHVGWLDDAWQVLLWSAAAVLVARARAAVVDREPGAQGRARLRGRVRLLLAAMPLLVTAAVLANDGRHVLVVAPLASAAAQGLALFGAVRLQLYGMARRTARTGALARDAAELERLALLGELGAVVAHEVRNPLTGIRSLAQRIGDGDVADPARRARFGQLIVTEVDRLERFVGSMLALAGDGGEAGPSHRNGDAPTAPLATLLEDVQALVAARAADRGVRVDVRTDAPGAVVPRGPLAQVLLNLVLNAIDHSPAGGTVALDARATAGGLEVVVRDAGPGIPPDRRAALFTPFAPGARGTGLGLAVVRRVADAQGWTVGVDDGPGPGATLRVRIPTAPSRGPLA